MKPTEIDEILARTFDDHRLSRTERRAFGRIAEELGDDAHLLDYARSKAFAMARESVANHDSRQIIDWLAGIVGALGKDACQPGRTSAHFSRRGYDECLDKLAGLLHGAERALDICVFTITDNRIRDEILAAHQRGMAIRIITDDEKVRARGSDIIELAQAGVPVKIDDTSDHMHHKFAIFDRELLLTGSYNWTRSAADFNYENFLVTDSPPAVAAFQREFEFLWTALVDLDLKHLPPKHG